jgi:LmbE family N-acetylglucosaminyl deacetylase
VAQGDEVIMIASRPVLADEASIYPYVGLDLTSVRSMLIFAPHPDDEVFGCGGLTALALDAGAHVQVVIVSDGGVGGDAGVRALESHRAAMALAGTGAPAHLEFWREPDRHVQADERLVARMRSCIERLQPQWVLVPSPHEIHPDHREVCVAATQATALAAGPAQLVYYEIGQPLPATALVDISAVLQRKHAAMQCFASQLKQQRYDEHVLALNRYRSYTLGAGVTHAEGLWLVSADELKAGLAEMVRREAQLIVQRLGLAP